MTLRSVGIALISIVFVLAAAESGLAQSGKKSAGKTEDFEQCPSAVGSASDPFSCICDAGQARSGSVWGSGPYTTDSALCVAARHAGVIRPDGGVVHVTLHAGQASYDGTKANGVETSSWGSYGSSFDFRASDGGAMAESTLPACNTMPGDADEHMCSCGPNPPIRSVWGNGPYTADSDICSAAIHNGYIARDEGGDVFVLRIRGLGEYYGSENEGVASSDWGAYESSITFDWNR